MKAYISADLRVINLHANDIIATSAQMGANPMSLDFGGDYSDGTIIGGPTED